MNRIMMLLLILFAASCVYTQNPKDMRSVHPITRASDKGEYKIRKTDEEWKQQLNPVQFEILRKAATERPFTGIYYKFDQPGIYYSAATGQPLFASDSKFDSGCGWPSFFEPIVEGSILYRTDRTHGMIRTEIIDSGSGSHLGHVFDDGPPPTGLRYCMNSAAMVFVGVDDETPELVRNYMENHASDQEKRAVKEFLSANKE
jgi:peptide-methionine (R)-S-oxide reductase